MIPLDKSNKMTQVQKEELKESIKEQIEHLDKESKKLNSLLCPLKKDCSLDTIAYQALIQEQTLAAKRLKENNMRENRLLSTLTQIDSQNYGICKECEVLIPLERLKLLPESIYCIDCVNELNL